MSFEERYPDLVFLQERANASSIADWPQIEQCPSEDVEGLYVFGVTPHIDIVSPWLDGDVGRHVLFIEEDISRIKAFIANGGGKLFSHPRIHLHYKAPEGCWDHFLENIALDYPLRHIQCISSVEHASFSEHRMSVIRKTLVHHGYHVEMLRYHKLFKNLYRNSFHLSESCDMGRWQGAFKGVPAIVCGAGPSLMHAIPEIAQCQDKALIFAGGSTIQALGNVKPHLALALDPNPEELDRLKFHTALDTPLLYGLRVNADIFREANMPLGYMESGTGGPVEAWLEKEWGLESVPPLEGLSPETLTVTLVAMKMALFLGCSPIVLAGVDLAYGKGKHYADGVVSEQQLLLEDKEQYAMQVQGVKTLAKWIMEGDVISGFTKTHPDTQFIDGTCQGLLIEGVERNPLTNGQFKESYDIAGRIHKLIQTTKYSLTTAQITDTWAKLRHSLERCDTLITKLLGETHEARKVVFEMDIQEELGYQLCLKLLQTALIVQNAQAYKGPEGPEDTTQIWQSLQEILQEYLAIL